MRERPASIDEIEQEEAVIKAEPAVVGSDGEPSRIRRTLFVFISTAVAFCGAMALSFVGVTKIAELVADGLITYMIAMGVTYIAGHSIDRSEVLTRIGESFNRRRGHSRPYAQPSMEDES